MIKNTGIISILVLLLIFGCQEIYYPDEIEENADVLVVEGYVSNGGGPHSVKLSYAVSFTSDKRSVPINGARVILSDDQGNTVSLINDRYGNYNTKPGQLEGVPGRKYKLNIRLPNGNIFESDEELMPDQLTNFEISTRTGETTIIDKNSYGDLIIKNYEGLKLFLNLSDSSQKFARIDVTLVSQYAHYVLYGPEVANQVIPYYYVYCWEKTRFLDYPIIFNSQFNGDKYEINDFELGFLTYLYNAGSATDTSSAPVPQGWVLDIKLHSINKSAYLFNNELKKQLMASEHIFDPLPSTITGNIRCLTDSNAYVTGFFEVSYNTSVQKAYYWHPGKKIIEKILENYTVAASPDCQDSIPPETWVDFN